MATIQQAFERAQDIYLEDSISGVEDISIENINDTPTLVFTFINEASRDKRHFTDTLKVQGHPVAYEYQVTKGPGASINVNG